MMIKKKKLNIGSQCTIANTYLRPGKTVADSYPNQTAQFKLENHVYHKKGRKTICKMEVDVTFFYHDDFVYVKIYCVP